MIIYLSLEILENFSTLLVLVQNFGRGTRTSYEKRELRPRNENFGRETRTSYEKRELRPRNENFGRETRTSDEKREIRTFCPILTRTIYLSINLSIYLMIIYVSLEILENF